MGYKVEQNPLPTPKTVPLSSPSPPPPPHTNRMSSAAAASGAAASKRLLLADDVPWRASPAGKKPLPRIHHSPVLRLPHSPNSSYALAVMKHRDPVGEGLAVEAKLEAAGPDCLVPGQATPVKLLGLKVWPINVNLGFVEPVGRQLQSIGKILRFIDIGAPAPARAPKLSSSLFLE